MPSGVTAEQRQAVRAFATARACSIGDLSTAHVGVDAPMRREARVVLREQHVGALRSEGVRQREGRIDDAILVDVRTSGPFEVSAVGAASTSGK